jgi:5-formyltetrahydrofolate cyclo-ligase
VTSWARRGYRCHDPTVEGKQTRRQKAESSRLGQLPVDLSSVVEPLLSTARQVASYVGFGSEPFVPPRPGWLLPVLLPDDDLDWAAYDGRLVPGGRGLLEPSGPRLGVDAIARCDLVLVPALLVDNRGNRLGKGGGSYDRALARATGLTVALLHDGELVESLEVEAHDVRVGAAATPTSGLIRFS